MSRYRKIQVRMWGDEKFCRLSAARPNGQTLWIYLLTGPHTTQVPGLFSAGEAALAEALGWPLKGFQDAFREIVAQGMVKFDWRARVVFIPNAIAYNPPESPNVILSWPLAMDQIPECNLRREAIAHLGVFVEGMGQGFREAFAKAFGEAWRHPMANQEQEQEEQEQENPPVVPPDGGTCVSSDALSDDEAEGPDHIGDRTPTEAATGGSDRTPREAAPGFDAFWAAYPRKEGKAPALKLWVKLKPDADLVKQIVAAVERQKRSPQWAKDAGQYIPHPKTWLSERRWEDEGTTAAVDEAYERRKRYVLGLED